MIVLMTILITIAILLYVSSYNIITRSITLFYYRYFSNKEVHHSITDYWAYEYGITIIGTTCCCFECLRNRTNSIISREIIKDYMIYLSEGNGNIFEKRIWNLCSKRFTSSIHQLNHDKGVNDNILPFWVEVLIDLYNNTYIRMIVFISIVYIIIVMTSHLWIGFIGIYNITTTTINNNTDMIVMYNKDDSILRYTGMVYNKELDLYLLECSSIIKDTIKSNGLIGLIDDPYYCITKTRNIWNIHQKPYENIDYDILIAYKNRVHPVVDKNDIYYTDYENKIYYTYNIIDKNDRIVKPNFIERELLLDELDLLRTKHNLSCICPVFLGIVDNVTFLYNTDSKSWIIMNKPYIYSNNILSNKIESSLVYEKIMINTTDNSKTNNVLYNNYMNFISKILDKNIINRHYAKYTIRYSEIMVNKEFIINNHDDITRIRYKKLKAYNKILIDHDVLDKCIKTEDPLERTIIFDTHILNKDNKDKYIKSNTIEMVISDENAICFNFCNNANGLYLN